jgi:hypothetical protein
MSVTGGKYKHLPAYTIPLYVHLELFLMNLESLSYNRPLFVNDCCQGENVEFHDSSRGRSNCELGDCCNWICHTMYVHLIYILTGIRGI